MAQTGLGEPTTKAYCQKVREKFGYTFTMAYDPTGTFPTQVGKSSNLHVLTGPDLTVTFKEVKPGLSKVETAIQERLAR